MNRRELVKAAGGVLVSHKLAMLGFDLKSPTGYVAFFDPKMMGSEFLDRAKEQGFPPHTGFYSVEVPAGKTLDDAIRIYTDS